MAEALRLAPPAHRDPPAPEAQDPQLAARQRRGARRTTLLLALIVLALYFGFIAYAVMKGLHGHH